MTPHAPGSLVTARGRDWLVLPDSSSDLLVLRPLGGSDDDIAAVFPGMEEVSSSSFAPPTPDDLGDAATAGLLRTALRVGFRSAAGPFRSLAGIAVEPRAYQLVPLLMALRQETARLLIADDVGVGKTVESGLIVTELLASGEAKGLAVLCSPALAEQWHDELRTKFGIDAELVLASTVSKLERKLQLGESLFDRHRHVIVSTDYIKSPKHRDEFVRHCPDLVIVDEAHGCVASDDKTGKQQQRRYELMRRLAADTDRHLLLLTATPHSGNESAFRNLLGLLDPELAEVDTNTDAGRRRLARHFVQRQRADIRKYLDQDTEFPSNRLFKDETYRLSPGYRKLLTEALNYARGSVSKAAGRDRRSQRIAWWSAIALLRSLVSSPRAASQTLTTRSETARAASAAEADERGRPVSFDFTDAEQLDGADVSPGAETGEPDETLKRLADLASQLEGPEDDTKLALAIKQVRGLLKEGYRPIVFCRYIPTAEYVAEQLSESLGKKTNVSAVTGTLSPQQRLQRIEELAASSADNPKAGRVLVATDCLSEGVNLQHHFDAIVHYDLAWNPTRHDQREGRVDRFGQRRDPVKVVTLWGSDNGVDGKVLDVLIKKHRRIRRDLGISVSVPDESSAGVTDAIVEWLLLHDGQPQEQPVLAGLEPHVTQLETQWQSAIDREKTSRSRYAQHAIHPEEVAAELAEIRTALGSTTDIGPFTRRALSGLGAAIRDGDDGEFTADVSATPVGLRDVLEAVLGPQSTNADRPVKFRTSPAVPRGEAALVRTDPAVVAVADFVLNAALDEQLPLGHRPARRCGVMRTDAVGIRTVLLLVRFRFQLSLPSRYGDKDLVAEDVRMLGFEGSLADPVWLAPEAVTKLLSAQPSANTDPDFASRTAKKILDDLPSTTDYLNAEAERLARELSESHRRVRAESGQLRRGLTVSAQKPPDLLGVYVYLPFSGAA